MADHFCTFLDFRSLTTNCKLPLIVPCNHYYSSALHSHNSRISRVKRRPLHLTLLSTSSSSSSSDLDVISTHEHHDGSLVFRFGDPIEAAKIVKTEDPKTVKEEIKRERENEFGDMKVVDNEDAIVGEGEDEFSDVEGVANEDEIVGEVEGASTPKVDIEHIVDKEEEDPTAVQSSILDEVSEVESGIAEEENNTASPEVSEKENTEVPSMSVPSISVDDNGGLQASVGTVVITDVSPISEHENEETKMLIETAEDGRESFDINTISTSQSEPAISLSEEIKEEILQDEIQEVSIEKDNKSDVNDIEALEMQNVMGSSSAVETSDAETQSPTLEAQASGEGDGMLDESVESVTEKDTIQLIARRPFMKDDLMLVEEADVGNMVESKDDEGSENLKVVGDLIETSVRVAEATESTSMRKGSKSNMNDIEALERQNETGNGSASGASNAEAMSPTMEDKASGTGIEILDETVVFVSEKDTTELITDSPQLEAYSVLEEQTRIEAVEESREDEATVIESTPMSQEMLRTSLVLSSGAALLPHPSKTGGEDAYFIAGQTWLGVADGVVLWSLEGMNPGVYAQELIRNSERLISVENGDSIKNPVELLNLSVAETDSLGSSTVLIAHFDGQAFHVANVGDSGFIVLRQGVVVKRSSPMNHAFHFPMQIERGDDPSTLAEVYRVDLEEGDVIITATDGLLDNLYNQEISLIVEQYLAADKTPQEIAEMLGMIAQEIGSSATVRSPFADDAQAAGIKGYTGGKVDDVAVIVSIVQTR